MSYIIPPRLKASDRDKGAMVQDQLLNIAAANDANIASARKAMRQNVVVPLTADQDKTPDELMMDTKLMEDNMLKNLLTLGFRGKEAQEITAATDSETMYIFNLNFPAIQADIGKKINIRLLTPMIFIEYLKKYVAEFNASAGMTTGGIAQVGRAVNALITSVDEVRAILPTAEQFASLISRVRASYNRRADAGEVLERLTELARVLPTMTDFNRLEQLNQVDMFKMLQEIQTATEDLPTRDQVSRIEAQLDRGDFAGVRALAECITPQMSSEVSETLREVRSIATTQDQQITAAEVAAASGGRAVKIGEWSVGDGDIAPSDWSNYSLPAKKQYLSYIKNQKRIVPIGYSSNTSYSSLTGANSMFEALQSMPEYQEYLTEDAGGGGSASSMISSSTAGVAGLFTGAPKSSSGKKGGLGIAVKKLKIGSGISYQEQPTYKEFGKYAIHIPQLVNQDVLNVKYKSLGQVPRFKPVAVSEPFKEFVVDLLSSGKANQRVYNQIAPEERKLFEKVATGAGIFNKLGLKKTILDTEADEHRRFEILRGEYIAGNTNQQLIKELRRFVVKFMNEGKITKSDGTSLLMELSI